MILNKRDPKTQEITVSKKETELNFKIKSNTHQKQVLIIILDDLTESC